MEHLIIGTAGHIDHGKTALIRALTGRETDTAKEEKERGITIDLGFTYFDLPGGQKAGIIDVPGHEKFLPNMLAGVCGMDLVLLVIALDEGVMPQTIEHMDILNQLGINDGILVLTKKDMVEPEWAEMMQEEIYEALSDTPYGKWESIMVSAHTGEGIPQLKELLTKRALSCVRSRDISGHFRMNIDRVLSLKGLGTVVAGTVLEGCAFVNQELMLYPAKELVRIKSIQSHGVNEEEAKAGQRAALLLAGVDKKDVHRGYVLAYPDSLELTSRVDVRLVISTHTKRVIKNQSRVHLHIGTTQVLARIILLDADALNPGEEGYASLVLDNPIAVKKKDKFVIRFLSPLETVGGGVIIRANAVKLKRFNESDLEFLKQQEEDKLGLVLLRLIKEQGRKPMSFATLAKESQLDVKVLKETICRLQEEHNIVVLPGKKNDYYLTVASGEEITGEIKQFFGEFHKKNPYKPGIRKAVLKSNFCKEYDPSMFDALCAYFEQENHLVFDGELVHSAEFVLQMDETLEALRKRLVKEFDKAKCDFVAISSLQDSKLSEEAFMDQVQALALLGEIVAINDSFFTTREIAADIVQKVEAFFEKEEVLSFASLRDMLNTSRRSAKPIMAYLDEVGVTLFAGKETERIRKP